MRNHVKTAALLLLAIAFSAFNTSTVEKLMVKDSTITWVGKKVTGQHEGTINLKSGYFMMDGESMVGGEFVIDMTSINVTDLQAGKGKEKLEGHLKSDDFFGVEAHPTATLTVKNAARNGNTYTVNADLTIKGKTNPITFDITKDGTNMTANVTIDRSKFDVRYGSGSFFDNLGDKTIYDDFDLTVNLSF
ncbi:YceI family protein [Gilvibacter sp.]|uniref:YceI family protein n=1 Tax=Gilvibacter sp. TaxID=2729997 RepID=UPI0035BE213F